MATYDNAKDIENEERYEEERWRDRPTKAQVRDALKELALEGERTHDRRLVAEWRAKHPEATCSDGTALALAYMAASVGRA